MFDLLWLQTFPGLEECMQSRPPLQLDLTGPKPTTYDPPTTLPWETSSPSYTMRPKTQPERGNSTTVHTLCDKYGEQGMAQWWEHSPPINVAWAQILVLTPYVGWVCCYVAGLCSSRALWPLVPNFCSWTTRKSQIFHTNHILGTLVFTGSEHWAPFHFPQSTALCWFSPFLWEVFIAVFPSPQKTNIFKFQFDQEW